MARKKTMILPIVRCSFCSCAHEDSDLLVSASRVGVYICQSCILSSVDVLIRERPKYLAKLKRKFATTRRSTPVAKKV